MMPLIKELAMPALQSVVLTDRATTPVNHTFTPFDEKDGVGVVVESSGVKIGDSKFSVSAKKQPSGRYKAMLKLEIPVVENEVVNGITIPTVTRTAYATLEFSYAGNSSTAERNNIVGMVASALATSKVLVNSTVVDLEGVW
jgi:hypothetical protein